METALLLLAIIFAVIMIILLPKYAKFIHTQPKLAQEKKRQLEEEQNSPKGRETTSQDE